MKKEIDVSAKTKEEAIAEAVEKLGAPNEAALVITVLNEGRKGFLGFGAVPASIHAVYQLPDAPAEGEEKRPRRPRDRRETDRRDSDRRETDRRETDRREGGRRGAGRPRPEKKPENSDIELPETEPIVRAPIVPVDPETATESEQTAYRFICRLAEDMGLQDVTVGMHKGDNEDMVITVDGEDAGVLIGHHGDTLDALQYLANLAANRKKEGEKREFARITVDVENYRAKREDALRILARKKALQVLKYKKSIMLEPMNPYERRIIHSEIQNMEGVSTNSIGVENNRRVVIYLETEGMPTAGIKGSSPESGKRSENAGRSRRRRPRRPAADPLNPDLLGTKPIPPHKSIFDGEEAKDPFDIDLSAATFQENEDGNDGETPDPDNRTESLSGESTAEPADTSAEPADL